jgi:prepilin-type N-terminal cleavage/methylation domain-containing protein
MRRALDRPHRAFAGRRVRRARRGLTMIEMMVTLCVLTIAVVAYSGSLVSTARLRLERRQESMAAQAARTRLEDMRATPFLQRYLSFNDSGADDPAGPDTAPGANFAVEGLEAVAGDADGMVGRVLFPTNSKSLREDVVDIEMGMPRDLNGDSFVDHFDHATDYRILPVVVEIQWAGPNGPRQLEMYTMFAATISGGGS